MKQAIIQIFKVITFPLKIFCLLLIYLYRFLISPFLKHTCRFRPSCSKYALKSFKEYGIFKGFLLSCKRIARCNPKSDGGVDPVPDNIKGEIKWVL